MLVAFEPNQVEYMEDFPRTGCVPLYSYLIEGDLHGDELNGYRDHTASESVGRNSAYWRRPGRSYC